MSGGRAERSGAGEAGRSGRSALTHVRSGPAFFLGAACIVACLGALAFGVLRPIGWSPLGLNVADSLIVLSAVSALAAVPPWNRWSIAAVVSGALAVFAWVTFASHAELGFPDWLGWALVLWAYVGPPATGLLAMMAGRTRWFAETPRGGAAPAGV